MTKTVQEIAHEIVVREAGYVDDPDDRGGPTKYGVTIHTMRRLGLDLDGDGDVDAADVKLLTVGQAVDIFVTHYFQKTGLAQLPKPLQPSAFDMEVNAGSNAIRILQKMLNQIPDTGPQISVDGACGPSTGKKAAKAFNSLGTLLVDAYGIERRDYYYSLADVSPSQRKYARRRDGGKGGWIARAEEFISPRFHLTNEQHSQRISKWN